MLVGTTQDILQSAGVMFIVGFALLFLIYYFTSPVYTEYGNNRSRLLYSFINSFYFSLVLAILFVVLPKMSEVYGVLISLAVGLAIILVSTFAQVYAVAMLVKSGFLQMRPKKRGQPGKGKGKGK
jgi:hypothetical protein